MHRHFLPHFLPLFTAGVAACAMPAPAVAAAVLESAAPLTLAAALALAAQGNPALSAARHELAAQDGAMQQAQASPNPELETLLEDTRKATRSTTVQLNQVLELGGKRAARVEVAERGRELAGAGLAASRADTRATVAKLFISVLVAQERLRLADSADSLARNASSIATRRVAAGKASPVEATRAQVAQAGVALELGQASRNLASARRQLAALWGNPAPRFSSAAGRLDQLPPAPDLTQLEAQLAAAPALQLARGELAQRQAMAALEQRRRVPDLTVSLGVKRSEELGRNQAIIGLSVPLPWSDTNQGNLLEALRRSDKAGDALAGATLGQGTALADACERLQGARQEVALLLGDIVPGAQSAYDAASKGFEFGKFAFLDVLDAQRTLLQVQTHYLEAQASAHQAAADIDRILGATTYSIEYTP